MYKEACEISAAPKTGRKSSASDRKPSAGDQWTALEQKPICTMAKPPITSASASDHRSTQRQGQSGTVGRRSIVKKHLDRITVAGLHNYLYATERYEKITWNLAFLISIIGTLFYLITTIRAYLEFTVVLDIKQSSGPAFRPPHVWVCVEAINVTYISEHFEKGRPKVLVDRRIRQLAKRFVQRYKPSASFYTNWNWSTMAYETVHSIWNPSTMSWEFRLEDIVDVFILWSKTFSLTSPTSDEFGKVTNDAHTIVEVLYRGVNLSGADWLGYTTFYEAGMFSCESVLKNCTLNGVPFDCCTHGSMGYTQVTQRCFQLDINQMANQQQSSSSVTLSFETIVDSLHFGEYHAASFAAEGSVHSAMYAATPIRDRSNAAAATETPGISVSFGPRMQGLFEISQPLASGTLSTITVQSTKKVARTGCVKSYRYDPRLHADSHPLITDYFKDMVKPERYTVSTCETGKLLDAIYIECGCVLYYDTIRPQNDSIICTPAHMYACLYETFHDVSPNADAGDDGALDELKRATMRHLKAASATECQPLCESWTYDFRASSMIAAGPEGNVSRYLRNKVIVIIDPEYRVKTEVYKMDYLTLTASLGVAFGCILGISAITLIQLPVWTVVAVMIQRKLKKVLPLDRHNAIHGRPDVHLHTETTV